MPNHVYWNVTHFGGKTYGLEVYTGYNGNHGSVGTDGLIPGFNTLAGGGPGGDGQSGETASYSFTRDDYLADGSDFNNNWLLGFPDIVGGNGGNGGRGGGSGPELPPEMLTDIVVSTDYFTWSVDGKEYPRTETIYHYHSNPGYGGNGGSGGTGGDAFYSIAGFDSTDVQPWLYRAGAEPDYVTARGGQGGIGGDATDSIGTAAYTIDFGPATDPSGHGPFVRLLVDSGSKGGMPGFAGHGGDGGNATFTFSHNLGSLSALASVGGDGGQGGHGAAGGGGIVPGPAIYSDGGDGGDGGSAKIELSFNTLNMDAASRAGHLYLEALGGNGGRGGDGGLLGHWGDAGNAEINFLNNTVNGLNLLSIKLHSGLGGMHGTDREGINGTSQLNISGNNFVATQAGGAFFYIQGINYSAENDEHNSYYTLFDIEIDLAAGTLVIGTGVNHLQGYESVSLNGQWPYQDTSVYPFASKATLSGDAQSNIFVGGKGDDHIDGREGDDIISADDGNDHVFGGSGNDFLNGGRGDDWLDGGLGDDTYEISGGGSDTLIEATDGGRDTVVLVGSVSGDYDYTLPENVEILDISVSWDRSFTDTHDVYARGNASSNEIWTRSFSRQTAFGLEGDDFIYATALGHTGFAEFYGGDGNDSLFGSEAGDTLNGGEGDDFLDGGADGDIMTGGRGNDTFVIDNVVDRATEALGGGVDLVRSSISLVLMAHVENLTLIGSNSLTGTGNSISNNLLGNIGSNRLDGKGGADTMTGSFGDDTYVVDNVGDVVNELTNQGTDIIETALDYILGANLEGLTLLGTGNKNGTGNELDNTLRGNSGANALKGLAGSDFIDGGLGADRMYGGIGDDTYVVDNVADLVVENAGEGTDEVQTSLSYILGTNLESLTLTGVGDLTGTGNSLANTLNGNAGANRLDGKSGADTMSAGLGDDSYVVENAGDVVIEYAGEGMDTVLTTLNYVLGANIENLTLAGTLNRNGNGNGLDNVIIGNMGNNVLKGLNGADTIDGAGGTDSLYGGLGPDTFVFKLGSGTDFIRDFSATDNDRIDIHAYTSGVTNTALLTTVGGNTLIDLGGGNTITVVGIVATDPGLLSHIVW